MAKAKAKSKLKEGSRKAVLLELAALDTAQTEEFISAQKGKLREGRFSVVAQKPVPPHTSRIIRRNIARAFTILGQKQRASVGKE